MSGASGRPSSSEVAQQAEGTRAHLASTLEQLRTNLQPANVMEEVVSNARIGAASVADNLVGVAKQYPIPSVLVAAGSALIMRLFSKRGDAGATDAASRSAPPTARADYARLSMPRPLTPRNPSTSEPAPGRGDSSPSGAEEARSGVIDALRRGAGTVYDSTSTQAGEVMQSVSRYFPSDRSEVKSKLATLFEEQPLVLGAIGLAIGAAIGAALPITETEDGLMGQASHRLRDSAADAARHEVDGMRSAAGEAMDNVRHSAEENLRSVVNKAGDSLANSRDV